MVSFINSWAQGIVLAVIISTLIEIILPEGNNKKYIKTIIGIYILFVIVQPIISKISNKNIDLKSIIKETETKMNNYETEELTLETNAYIEQTYINKIKEDVTQKIKEKGYEVTSLNLNIETKNEEYYGEVKNINMQISKIENNKQSNEKNTVNRIENVEIKISDKIVKDKEITKSEEISEEEIEILKEYLSNEYGMLKEEILINE